MPDSTLKQAIKEAYAVAPVTSLVLPTLELRHPAFTAPIRVVLDHAALAAYLEDTAPENAGQEVTFLAMNFRFTKPEVSEASGPEMTIEIDNVTAEIEENIAAANVSTGAIAMTYREYLVSDLSGPQNDPPMHMEIKNIQATDLQVEARASFGNFANRRFPREIYTLQRFPALGR